MKREETLLYNFVIRNIANKYDYTELIKIFLSPEEFELYTEDEFDALMGENKSCPNTVYFNDELSETGTLSNGRFTAF